MNGSPLPEGYNTTVTAGTLHIISFVHDLKAGDTISVVYSPLSTNPIATGLQNSGDISTSTTAISAYLQVIRFFR